MAAQEPIRSRGKIHNLVRRLLFPDEHEREQLLLNLLQDLDQAKTEQELAALITEVCEQAFQPQCLYLYLRRARRFRLLSSLGPAGTPVLPPLPEVEKSAWAWREAKDLQRLGEIPGDERQALRQPGASGGVRWLVAGCDREQRGCVLLLLGERAQGEYTAVQRDLLQSLVDAAASRFRRLFELWQQAHYADQNQARWLRECPECGRCHDAEQLLCLEDDAELEPTLMIERRIQERYLLERRLGRGAMGAVFAALDQQSGQRVAVKVLATGDAVSFGRFTNEAKAGRTLKHPNLVQVLDTGSLGKQSAFMVMEYVVGKTLRQVLDQNKEPQDPRRVAVWFDQILSAVAFAHDHGIVHRDLKPENLMVLDGEPADRVKILDFGLAKLLRRGSGPQLALTMAGMVIGTLSYMSPEQLAGEVVDHRTDLFALGVMVSEALTGRLPFRGDNLGQMLRAVTQQPFSLETHTAAQAAVAEVLGHALAKKPEDRYPDVETFRRALIPVLERCERFPAPSSSPAGPQTR